MASTMSLTGVATAVAKQAPTKFTPNNTALVADEGPGYTHKGEEYYSRGLRARFRLDGLKLDDAQPVHEPPADIDYEFDEEKYLARVQARLAQGGLTTELPDGWPRRLDGPMVWVGDDFRNADGSEKDEKYVYVVTAEQKREIWAALLHFKALGLDPRTVSPETFPLPTLGPTLLQACKDIYEGHGFFILRGFDEIDSLTPEDLTAVYLGISSYIAGRRGKQDQKGSMLMHAIQRTDIPEQNRDNADKPFHTDTVCDCLCLITKNCAAKGGQSILASGLAVYNVLAATRPDLIHVLAKPDWPFDTHGRKPAYYRRAVLYYYDNKIIWNFSRRLLVGCPPLHPRSPGIPGLTEAQAEALDAVHYIARQLEHRTRMVKGDVRFINNMGLLHRREAFEDAENDANGTRHLIRVWLDNEAMCWNLPRDLRVAWARVFEDSDRSESWDHEPPRYANGVLIRVAGSCD